MISSACVLRSGLKFILQSKAQSLILAKSLFRSFADVLMSSVTQNKDVLSANVLKSEEIPVVRSKTTRDLKWISGELLW